jgi:hypothetical protein
VEGPAGYYLKTQGLLNETATQHRGSEIQRRMAQGCIVDPAVGTVHGFTVDQPLKTEGVRDPHRPRVIRRLWMNACGGWRR